MTEISTFARPKQETRAVPSIRRLRVICQKEKLRKPDDLTRKHRAVSIYATWLLVRTGVSADQVTIASIVSGLAASLLLGAPGLTAGLAGVLVLYMSFCLDQVDGEVARYWKRTSLRGVYLDEIRHLVIYSAPVFALAFSVARATGSSWPFAAGFVAALGLTLARIEARLPAMIFGERATELLDAVQVVEEKLAEKASTAIAQEATTPEAPQEPVPVWAAKRAVRAANAAYEAVAHQVLILIWLLVAVVADRGFGRAFGIGLEGFVLLLLAGSTLVSLVAAIGAHSKPGAIETDVRARALSAVASARREAVEISPDGCNKRCASCGS